MNTLRLVPLLLLNLLLVACASTKQAAVAPQVASAVITPSEVAVGEQQTGNTPTSVEEDFNLIYGSLSNVSGTPALDGAAPFNYDPWEKWNRKVHGFNMAIDRAVVRPVAVGYTEAIPAPIRNGVHNFFDNIEQPWTAFNSLLQGRPRDAWDALGRFLINSTFGVVGFFDVASRDNVPKHDEDFGQTLSAWGWCNSRYVELPFLGPRTVRDTAGVAVGVWGSPIGLVEKDKVRYLIDGIYLVDLRAQLLSVDAMLDGALDEYALMRDGWLQRRNYKITRNAHCSRCQGPANDDLPAYLLEE